MSMCRPLGKSTHLQRGERCTLYSSCMCHCGTISSCPPERNKTGHKISCTNSICFHLDLTIQLRGRRWWPMKSPRRGSSEGARAGMDTNVFSSSTAFTAVGFWEASQLATAPPRERPKSAMEVESMSSRARRWSSAACASSFSPRSEGVPSLSPYPRYDRMKTFTSSRAISCITFSIRCAMLPAFSWRKMMVGPFLSGFDLISQPWILTPSLAISLIFSYQSPKRLGVYGYPFGTPGITGT
mmetsp:Transcript_10081/g.21023  ORF Transcript_10081/g.21023 Transcript_10081/m.21023 type:complete len:241 (+) Transcript_10081:450-1172(+)